MSNLPPDFVRTVTDVHGNAGADWLARLPDALSSILDRWSLEIAPPIEPLSYNYVAHAVRADGTPVTLKAGVPCRELTTEIAALTRYDGRGAVRLLESDETLGMMLLERAVPGVPLRELGDEDRATEAAADVMLRLRPTVPEEHVFPTVRDWARGLARFRDEFEGGTGPFPSRLVEKAESAFVELLDSAAESVVLHGDLHHWNILSAEREPWLAIDPKGVVGEPAYEVGAFLRNPLPDLLDGPSPERALERRVDIFEERLGFPRDRMLMWTFAQAVLSAWWYYEDHGRGWEATVRLAELLESVR